MGEWKFVQTVLVAWPRWPPCPYMVKTLKSLLLRTKRPMTLKHAMQHRMHKYYQVCSNDDPGLTLTYFTASSNLAPYAFVWEKGKAIDFYAPPPESGGVLCYTLRNFECPSVCLSVRPSVCPSVRPSAPTTILVSATPPTVLGQSFWNFTGVLRMVWRYAYCFFRILKLFFITFFPFLT